MPEKTSQDHISTDPQAQTPTGEFVFREISGAEFEQTFHPIFEVVRTKAGAISIRNKVVNETMHNPVGPWLEANSLYIDQSGLREKLAEHGETELVVFDVGLGAAANALATLACYNSLPEPRRCLRIVSFERDLDLLRFALEHARYFDHFNGYESALHELLEHGKWQSEGIIWELRHGEFPELIQTEPNKADLIFYDPYSPNLNQEMWTTQCFTLVRAKSRSIVEGGTELFTYSIATRVRVSMMLAGFYVGYGRSTGAKTETTQASTSLAALHKPIGADWRERWRRSHVRNSFDCRPGEEAAEDAAIERQLSSVIEQLGQSNSSAR